MEEKMKMLKKEKKLLMKLMSDCSDKKRKNLYMEKMKEIDELINQEKKNNVKKVVSFRVTENELENLKQKSLENKMTLSNYLKSICLNDSKISGVNPAVFGANVKKLEKKLYELVEIVKNKDEKSTKEVDLICSDEIEEIVFLATTLEI